MKGGLAVAMVALAGASRRRHALRGTLVVHFAIDEELGGPGTQSLIDHGFGGELAIVLEPTRLGVATAGRGRATYAVEVVGRAGHAGAPGAARNPLLAATDRELEVGVTDLGGGFPPAESPADGPFAELVRDCVLGRTGTRPAPWGTPYASDVSRLAPGCREAVVFGPGDIAHAHQPDERVAVDELEAAVAAIGDVIDRVLGAG